MRKRKKKSRYKKGLHNSPKAGLCSYRSGWELLYMKYLDQNDHVKSYQYEKLVIEYISNKKTSKTRKYYPDFLVEYVDSTVKLVEIKPSRRVNQQKNLKKFLAATDWCRSNNVQFEIVTEVQLKELGLL